MRAGPSALCAAGAAAACLLAAGAASGEPAGAASGRVAPAADDGLRFVVEYLPPLVYERESVSLRFRIENPAKTAVTCRVEVALSAGDDAVASPEAAEIELPAGGKRSGGFELPCAGWSRAECSVSSGGGRSRALVVRRFGECDDIPQLLARGERLYVKDSGRATGRASGPDEAAVVVLRQRVSADDREWLMVKRLVESLSEGTVPAGVTLLGPAFGASAGEKSDDPPAYFRAVREGAGTWVEATALPGEAARGVTNPILADFATALAALEGSRPAELVIWVVACDDARRATPVRTFRKAADFLLVRARRRSGRVAVLFVPEPAVLPKRRAVYAEELRRSTLAFKAAYSRVEALGDADLWRLQSAGPSKGALGRYPNPEGHAALAEAILERIRP